MKSALHVAIPLVAIATSMLPAQTTGAPCFEADFGVLLGNADDTVFPAITLNAPYPAFGTGYFQVEVSSNGFVWLGANGNQDSGCCSGTGVALGAGAARICALWTDLVTDGVDGSGVYHKSAAGRDVITWANAFESYDPSIRFTIQLQLVSTGEFTVWFHPSTTIAQPPHSGVCGASPGGVVAPASLDLSLAAPHDSGTQATIHEEWATGAFDLGARAFEFLQNGLGGWLLQERTTCPFLPGSWSTYGAGCPLQTGISGASFYELFDGTTLDLANLEFELLPFGNAGYTVQATSNSFWNGYSNLVPLQDDQVLDQTLPFAFPHPGGVCTIAGFCSNGFVWLDNFNNSAPAAPYVPGFLFDGPRIAALWTDLDLTVGGTAYFDTTATTAYFTWVDAPDFHNPTLRSTFQVQLFDDGRIKLCYQGVNIGAVRPALAGYGLGGATHDPGSLDLSASPPFTSGMGTLPITLDWIGVPPVVGKPFPMVAGNLRPTSVLGILVLGLTQYNPGISLDGIGMTNCFLYASLDVVLPVLVTPPTTAINILSIVPDASFVGQQWLTQLVVFDPGITFADLASSNGGAMSLGLY
jgi:hypothetical protein